MFVVLLAVRKAMRFPSAEMPPVALNVVNAPVLGVVAPMAVEFSPVEVNVPTKVPFTPI